MERWKFDIAIKLGDRLYAFDGDTFTTDGADPRDLARLALTELVEKYPQLRDGQIVRCGYTRLR